MTGTELPVVELDRAARDIDGAFGSFARNFDPGARLELHADIEQRRESLDGAYRSEGAPGDQIPAHARGLARRQCVRVEVVERGFAFFVFLRQRDPCLDAMHESAALPHLFEPLGM